MFSVLIIDDEKEIVAVVKEVLEKKQVQVFVAHTINEGLSTFSQHMDVNAICFDGQMPIEEGGNIDTTGESAANLVREILKLKPKATLIAASNTHNHQLREAGCTDIVFNKADLPAVLIQLQFMHERHKH